MLGFYGCSASDSNEPDDKAGHGDAGDRAGVLKVDGSITGVVDASHSVVDAETGASVSTFSDTEGRQPDDAVDGGGESDRINVTEAGPGDSNGDDAGAMEAEVLRCDNVSDSVFHSCVEVLANNPAAPDGLYAVDPDGSGGNSPFCVYCLMTEQDGGWTLYAHHQDGIDVKATLPIVTPDDFGVLKPEDWQAVQGTMNVGMLFIDEYGRQSLISKDKLDSGNCVRPSNVPDLVKSTTTPSASAVVVWHNEDSACDETGLDYSIIQLAGDEYPYRGYAGAALYQHSSVKFDLWPYSSAFSHDEQNELLYFLK